jgi:hypothetical protein
MTVQVARAYPAPVPNQSDDLSRAGGLPCPLTGPVTTVIIRMPYRRRRRVFIDTPKGRVSAGFTVPATDDDADVSMKLRERGWAPYRLRLEPEQHAWVAVVIDWQRAA